MHFDLIEGLPIVSVRPSPLEGWGKIAKRMMDIAGGLFGILLFAPVFLIVAFMVKWESKGPVLVKLKRVSGGKEFEMYKFRSMIDNAESYKPYLEHLNERTDGPLFKIANDPRITATGAFLRSHRLDELPQFFNVIKGNISLVGPRPHEPREVEKYQDHHKRVFAIKPGLTGFAQISGASNLPFEEEVKLDRYYIEHWSIRKDFSIVLKTAWMLFFDRSGV